MAKKRKISAVQKKRGKKKWFKVVAPEVYKKAEIGEITAYEPTEIVGRQIEIMLSELSNSSKDREKKIVVKVNETKGETAMTEVKKYYLLNSFIQRISRRFKSRFEPVFYVNSKDGKKIKFKLSILLQNKVPVSLRSGIIKEIVDQFSAKVSKKTSDQIFEIGSVDKICNELRTPAKKLYPIDRIYVWKMSVL
jgi:ribosomal protein S3AE